MMLPSCYCDVTRLLLGCYWVVTVMLLNCYWVINGLLLGCYWVVTGIVVGADRVFESGRRGFGRGEADDFDGAIVRRRGHGVGADPTGVAHRLQVQPQALHGR